MPIPHDEAEADKFAESILAPWRDNLIKTANGTPKAILANAITALRAAPEWAGKLQFDAFRASTMLKGKPPWSEYFEDRQWTESDDIRVTDWMHHNGLIMSSDNVGKAIELVARDQTYHPILDYLQRLKWDGEPRLDEWLIWYIGGPDNAYTRAIGSRWMISAVARVMLPGCKADCALILEGKQGAKKSTALRTLFFPWFSDELAEFGTKDAAMQLPGAWCFEIAELDSMHRADTSKIKAFMSRNVDRFRPAYGHRVIEQPRQCVFGGTVNHNEYLRDDTGGRRFWPVEVGYIDIDQLSAARDQLWAEARDRYLADEIWWLDSDDLIATATEEQTSRRRPDPWDDEIARLVMGRDSVSPAEICTDIGIPIKDQTQLHANRAADCLKALGWTRKSVRYIGAPRRRYVPPA